MNRLTSRQDQVAIVLAAGRGSRISEVTSDPKILLPINDETILERHLRIFVSLGIQKVSVVVGYKKDKVIEAARQFSNELDLTFVCNDDFDHKGNGYSLFLGIAQALAPVLIFDGDVVYSEKILERFVDAELTDALLVGKGALDDIECAKTLVDTSNVIRKTVDKRALTEQELGQYRFAGEAVGIMKFSAEYCTELIHLSREFFSQEQNLLLNWEHLLSWFFEDYQVGCHLEESTNWIEIDTPADYREACSLFATPVPARSQNK